MSRPARRKVFDKAYYDKFYRDADTRVVDDDAMRRLVAFVAAYLRHLGVDVATVLDLGCGLGTWKTLLSGELPTARYTGVEISEYLCAEYGWRHGSVVDFHSRKKFDLVICQGVLQYLDDRSADAAIVNLDKLCVGAMFLEVLTAEDWKRNCDRSVTDGSCYLRPAAWYAERLHARFTNCGGGVYLSRHFEHYVYALDRLDAGR